MKSYTELDDLFVPGTGVHASYIKKPSKSESLTITSYSDTICAYCGSTIESSYSESIGWVTKCTCESSLREIQLHKKIAQARADLNLLENQFLEGIKLLTENDRKQFLLEHLQHLDTSIRTSIKETE